MKKTIIISLIMSLLLTGCSTGTPDKEVENDANNKPEITEQTEQKEGSSNSEIIEADGVNKVIDDLGIEVTLPDNPERIVIADLPPLLHTYHAVNGSTEGLVGTPDENAISRTILPLVYPEVLSVDTGFRSGGSINIEELLALNPDVIFYRSDNPETAKMIQDTGVPAVAFQSFNNDNGNTITPVSSWVNIISDVLNKEPEQVLNFEEKAYKSAGMVHSRIWDVEEKVGAAYLTVTPESIKMNGNGLFGAFYFETVGAEFVADGEIKGSQEVSQEQLLEYNPEIIFTSFSAMTPEEIMSDPRFADIQAVKDGRVYAAPEGIFSWYGPSLDVVVSILWHAKLCYPEQFADVDVVQLTKEHFKETYGYEMSDEVVKDLFGNSLEELYAK